MYFQRFLASLTDIKHYFFFTYNINKYTLKILEKDYDQKCRHSKINNLVNNKEDLFLYYKNVFHDKLAKLVSFYCFLVNFLH